MKILTSQPLFLAPFPGRLSFPGHTLTLVVKGVFRLEEGRLEHPLPEEALAFPTGDVEEEGEGEAASIRYASDFVHYKPQADLLLVGRCRPPEGRPVESCPVSFQVGDQGLELVVSGDRWWSGEGGVVRMTDPLPFTEMELGWERAYGGPRCPDNPVGRGHEPVVLDDGREAWPLPNIEFPNQRVRAPEDRPVPAGFGPIPMTWEPRRSRSGTYDSGWLRDRWPWFPADQDWALFNAAPFGLECQGFLNGDEEIHLRNVVPGIPRFSTRLPGIRVRCFVNALPPGVDSPPRRALEREEWEAPDQDAMDFREVPVNLDTLWIDAEKGLVALVWRGYTPIRNEEFSEIRHVFVHAESLAEPPASSDACLSLFVEALADEEGAGEAGEEAETSAPTTEMGGDGDPDDGDDDALFPDPEDEDLEVDLPFDANAKLRADLEAMGIDPDNPPQPTREEREQAKEVFRELGRDDLVALLELMDEEEEVEEGEAPPPEVSWSREMVQARHEAGESLDGLDLRGLDLSGLDLSGLQAVEVDLTGAQMRGTQLEGADLKGAKLVKVDLSEARLAGALLLEADLTDARLNLLEAPEADFSSASLPGADLTGADLTGAILEHCNLRGAVLTGARAEDAVFVEADLSDATLIRGSFARGDFTGAILSGVDAREALFPSAEFFQVRALGAMLAGADLEGLRAGDALDLSGANLSQVRGADSNWSGVTLKGAVLAWAVLDGADFSGANLEGADFYAAHLTSARFSKAHMLDARLAAANAFEAAFDGADLARADLRDGNFYGAEFLDARLWETLVEGANLKMTKHG